MRTTRWASLVPHLFGVSFLGLALLSTGCHVGPRMTGPVRAIWVTRFDYRTADDVTQIVDDCADAGFNHILFQVRGNGTAFYDSAFEPWADELGGSDPGFDPLALACDRAHAHGVKLHAYVNVMPAWRGTDPPKNPDQLYNKHPDWFWYDQHGQRQALSSFYVSLNPCLPEVREYIVDVFRDLAKRYDVDGLHLDYIRFPNEPPAIPRGSGLDYPRDERTLALYHAETGLAPDDDQDAWNEWRCAQVTQLVADIHTMLRRTKPAAALTASVGVVPANGLTHFQDGRTWINRDIIDAVFLMNYTRGDRDQFGQRLDAWASYFDQTVMVPGLWFFGRIPVEDGIAMARHEIEVAREATGNFCFFAYSSLFDSTDDQLSQQDEEGRAVRRQRREALVPFLQSLAEE